MKLLKFSAEWCGPCNEMKKRLKDFNACPVVEYDVDDDVNDEIVTEYGITNIPVLILVDDCDNIIKKWVGLTTVDEINNAINNYKN